MKKLKDNIDSYVGFVTGMIFMGLIIWTVAAFSEIRTQTVDFDGNVEVLNGLNNDTMEVGDTIKVEITEVEENPVFGDILWLGDYMYMVGNTVGLQKGDIVTFPIKDAQLLMDLWVIQYESVE